MSDDITIGEIGRSLKRLEDSQLLQTTKLDEIKEQTTITNGRVGTLEREMREVKRDRKVEHHEFKRASDRPDVITVSIPAGAVSPKTVTLVIAGLVSGLIAAWKAGLFQ